MSESTPSLSPGQSPGSRAAASSSASMPSLSPPAAAGARASDCGCKGASHAAAAAPPASAGGASLQAPSLRPGGAAGAVAAAWHSNVHVIGMWSINQDRNCWAYLDDVGWRNLSGASESGLVALNMLASHAYDRGSVISLFEGDDGRIGEIYVW